MSHAHHARAHHAPGKIYLFILSLALFGALSQCAGPDFAPVRAFGADWPGANIPAPPPDFSCGWPFTPLYDLIGRRWICYAELPPPAEPHASASAH